MGGKGTLDGNLESTPWVLIDGKECFAVRLFCVWNEKYHISYPSRYYEKMNPSYRPSPALITIAEEYKTGARKGNLKAPDVYELHYFRLINKVEQPIQGGRTDGKFVPLSELRIYKHRTSEEAKKENAEAMSRAKKNR